MSGDVSLIAYVYGEHAVLFGHQRYFTDVLKSEAEARSFLAGEQLGWCHLDSSNVIPYRAKLSRFRPKILPYLLLPMARPITATTSLRKGDKGEAVVIVTNPKYPVVGQKPAILKEMYTLDCQAVGLKPSKFRLKVITATEEKDLGTVEGAMVQFEIALAPQESAVYVLKPSKYP